MVGEGTIAARANADACGRPAVAGFRFPAARDKISKSDSREILTGAPADGSTLLSAPRPGSTADMGSSGMAGRPTSRRAVGSCRRLFIAAMDDGFFND